MRMIAVIFAGILALSSAANAAGITTLFNTGVDASGKVMADGTADIHYRLTQQPGTSYTAQVASGSLGNGSGMDSSKSQFIGPNSDSNADGPGGTYTYRTTFSLAGYNPASAIIQGVWSADDLGLDILLNGTSIGVASQPTWYTAMSFKILSGFVTGLNTLDFVVRNDQGATGLRVEMAGTANAVPEPASISLLMLGLLGAGIVRYRKYGL